MNIVIDWKHVFSYNPFMSELRRQACRKTGLANRKHGFGIHKPPTYISWRAMRSRCLDKTSKDYKRWGANGVTICDQWSEYLNFESDMGIRPEGMTLDRIDNTKGYSPENCRWATPHQQGINRKTTVFRTIGDETMATSEWCKRFNIPRSTFENRLIRGWSVERALCIEQ